jgi:REP element-mobilizing transposase RayT
MDRFWLLTWTMYGNWLPGDERGFVGSVSDGKGGKVTHNIPGTQYDSGLDCLRHSMAQRLRCPPIRLILDQAEAVLSQFHETCSIRRWRLIAAAVMANHCHVVVGVPGDPEPERILGDIKSYASGALNQRWAKPASKTWWTESGSKRKLKDDPAILAAVAYVRDQEFPLVIWIDPIFANELGSGMAPGKIKDWRLSETGKLPGG